MLNQMLNNNPMFARAKQMAQGKSEEELKQIASNLCQQRGINLEQAFEEFKKQMNVLKCNF